MTGNEDRERKDGRSRPRSVRSMMGQPERGDQEPSSPQAPPAGEGSGDSREADVTRRPTPARASLEELAPGTSSLQPPHIPARRFEMSGSEWIARVAGVTLYGTGSTPRAPILSIQFFRGEEPDAPVKEIMTPGRSLDGWGDGELQDLFRQAQPIRREERREGSDERRSHRRRGRRK